MNKDNKIYVTKPFLPPINEYIHYLEKIWETNILTNDGPLHKQFEQNLKTYFKWENVSLLTNGHLALEIALKSLDLKPGGEIITTPFTFISTAAAIVNQGFIPVFCDIGDNFTIDSNKIEALITDKTVAILPVHVYGFPCDVEKIQEIADRHSLKVLYDAAHALGVKFNGKDISSYGDISMFSFHATKLFHTIEGGALVYSDSNLKREIELYKNFGITGPESVEAIGLNAKMNEFQSAMGLVLLKYFDEIISKRKVIYERYLFNLNGIQGIKTSFVNENSNCNYAYMPVLFDGTRDKVFEYLEKNNIFARKYFYPCISDIDCYKMFLRGNSLENSERISREIITLPIYPSLDLSQVDFICQTVIDGLMK